MERLTERINGKLKLKKQFPTAADAIDVLADRLELFEDAEEQGRLIILPVLEPERTCYVTWKGKADKVKRREFYHAHSVYVKYHADEWGDYCPKGFIQEYATEEAAKATLEKAE